MSPLDAFLTSNEALYVGVDGQMLLAGPTPRVLFPGSFNPVHRAHWRLAEVAEASVGAPAAFEISVANVDKPDLTGDEIRRRLAPFHWQAPVWLTHAPRFVEKAERFPNAVFVVGADTAARIVSPLYYPEPHANLPAALERIRACGCRFLVACRATDRGQCIRLGDLPIPPQFASLFEEIPAEVFRWDISSTELRALENMS